MGAQNIKNVTCIGGGTIGASWAVCFAMNGLAVKLYDISDEALEAARMLIMHSAETLKKCEVLDLNGHMALLNRMIYTTDIEFALEGVDYIQESTPENFKVKHRTVEAIEAYAPVTAICGSSTSRMRISDICKFARHKERYIVTHPYNPPHLVPLVELAKGPDTSPETEQTTYDFFKRLNKEPIILKKESLGFVGNRYQAVLDREMADLVGRGVVSLEDANKAISYGPGFRYSVMGPTMVYDLGSAAGLRGLVQNMDGSGINLLEDVANWTVNPHAPNPNYYDEVDEMWSGLPDGAGQTRESAAAWRDQMLIAQLRLHGKL